ncbi:MAG: hypothetical protein JNK04_21490 [Myxococcales bacterium]|nr:hypothetical protein [Myxococcales bacterium]
MSSRRSKWLGLTAHALVVLATSLGATGCEWVLLATALSDDDPCDGDPCCNDPCCGDPCCQDGCWEESVPPEVTFVIPDWPPIGPDGTVEVQAFSDMGLSSAAFTFRNSFSKPMSGVSGSVFAAGSELGEGQGTLVVQVNASDGSFTRASVDDLLVDLGPPTAYLDDTVLPATGSELRFWISDDWVVSGYELDAGGTVFTETLEPGYPSTLGLEWDFSLVSIPVEQLPVGSTVGSLRVFDAAGNNTILELPFVIDGQPPSVDISEPLADAAVSGTFNVAASAADDNPFTVAINIYVGGVLVGTGVAPNTSVTLDASEFPLGPIELTAIAVDAAGNESPVASRNIVITDAPDP